MKEIDDIVEQETTVNTVAFRSGKDLTSKLFLKGRLLTESIHDIIADADRKYLAAYVKDVLNRYHTGSLDLVDGAGI